MPLFDFYIMVDWSGAARRVGMRADSIWIAFGSVEDESPKTLSPFSRSEAIHLVRELLHTQFEGRRTLLCFDFAYAFPRDFAAALQAATGAAVALCDALVASMLGFGRAPTIALIPS
jgi:hypothetical protein